jgi:hypothetical protein
LEGGRLVSIAVPYAGVRWIPSLNVSYLAVDLSVYSAYFTSASSDLSTKATTCTAGMNQLERLLPCEANPQMRPYAAMQLGVTIGRSGIGYVTASPISFGIAQIGNQGLAPYYGMVVSSLQITGQF